MSIWETDQWLEVANCGQCLDREQVVSSGQHDGHQATHCHRGNQFRHKLCLHHLRGRDSKCSVHIHVHLSYIPKELNWGLSGSGPYNSKKIFFLCNLMALHMKVIFASLKDGCKWKFMERFKSNKILNITKHFNLYCCDVMQTWRYWIWGERNYWVTRNKSATSSYVVIQADSETKEANNFEQHHAF